MFVMKIGTAAPEVWEANRVTKCCYCMLLVATVVCFTFLFFHTLGRLDDVIMEVKHSQEKCGQEVFELLLLILFLIICIFLVIFTCVSLINYLIDSYRRTSRISPALEDNKESCDSSVKLPSDEHHI